MIQRTTTGSLRDIFIFPFRSPNWQNRFIIASVLNLAGFIIPILPSIFLYGYVLQVMRSAIEGKELELPPWEDWGALGVNGLRGAIVSFVYMLPGLALSAGGTAVYLIAIFGMAVSSEMGGDEGVFGLLLLAAMAVFFLSLLLGMLFLAIGAIPLPVATARFLDHDRLGAAFQVRAWWAVLRANKLGYFIAWVIALGLFGLLYLLMMMAYYSILFCCMIPILVAPLGTYLSLVGAALFGATYRESQEMLGADAT